jgi:predicted RecB family endonuclease
MEADMSEKSALFMARTTRFHEFARSLTTTLGVEVSLATRPALIYLLLAEKSTAILISAERMGTTLTC